MTDRDKGIQGKRVPKTLETLGHQEVAGHSNGRGTGGAECPGDNEVSWKKEKAAGAQAGREATGCGGARSGCTWRAREILSKAGCLRLLPQSSTILPPAGKYRAVVSNP